MKCLHFTLLTLIAASAVSPLWGNMYTPEHAPYAIEYLPENAPSAPYESAPKAFADDQYLHITNTSASAGVFELTLHDTAGRWIRIQAVPTSTDQVKLTIQQAVARSGLTFAETNALRHGMTKLKFNPDNAHVRNLVEWRLLFSKTVDIPTAIDRINTYISQYTQDAIVYHGSQDQAFIETKGSQRLKSLFEQDLYNLLAAPSAPFEQ